MPGTPTVSEVHAHLARAVEAASVIDVAAADELERVRDGGHDDDGE